MKKILLLGGSHGQLPAIYEAKKRGLFTILCDYLPDNPGAAFADEFHLVSTTDKEAVLNMARERQIDFVLAYASDPAALTAASVSEALGLPGNTVNSINTLADKAVFRQFLRKNGFNVPVFEVFNSETSGQVSHTIVPLPLVVKPVDSSDTKGVQLIRNRPELEEATNSALCFSKKKVVILEEYIDAEVANLHGDGFVHNDQLVFCMLGDLICNSYCNPLKPSSTLYPGSLSENVRKMVQTEISRAVSLSGFREGPVNIEARINKDGRFYIMEIGPRSGGSLTPQTIFHSSGFDMLGATFDVFMGQPLKLPEQSPRPAICFTLHVNCAGIFQGINLDKELIPYVMEEHIYVRPGDLVKSYKSAASTLGVYIFKFQDMDQVNPLMVDFYDRVVGSVRLG
jgi:biotin carboxylase